jgi:hypothetical protein
MPGEWQLQLAMFGIVGYVLLHACICISDEGWIHGIYDEIFCQIAAMRGKWNTDDVSIVRQQLGQGMRAQLET